VSCDREIPPKERITVSKNQRANFAGACTFLNHMDKPKYVTKRKRIRQLETENAQLRQEIEELKFQLNANTLLMAEAMDLYISDTKNLRSSVQGYEEIWDDYLTIIEA